MASESNHGPLGRQTDYVSRYTPALLFPIKRQEGRSALPPGVAFYGVDIWTGYEISWLEPGGKPRVAVGEFIFPCDSDAIVESKSFKLYLNSFNQSEFESLDLVEATLARDLSNCAGAPVEVSLHSPASFAQRGIQVLDGICLDDLSLSRVVYHPEPGLLRCQSGGEVEEQLYSDLLKTNCPVTGQPDWATLIIHYRGKPIDHESLLAYIVSFREHQDFHEQCVERIFSDLMRVCEPAFLSVYARYTRRGGLDINPFRATDAGAKPPVIRLVRQ